MPKPKLKPRPECPKCIRSKALTGRPCVSCRYLPAAKKRKAKPKPQPTMAKLLYEAKQQLIKNTQALNVIDTGLTNLRQHVDRMLASLTPREREVFNARFGIKKESKAP